MYTICFQYLLRSLSKFLSFFNNFFLQHFEQLFKNIINNYGFTVIVSVRKTIYLKEPISFAQKCVIGLLRLILPPHVDNETAADFLRTKIGQNNQFIEWAAVRPDGLMNENEVTDYEIHASPTRSAIFNAGKVSRINVAHFMAKLISDGDL